MRFRPYVTTGLAFVGAAVIVATPITSPHDDVQVSAVAVSTNGQSPQDVLDPAFLDKASEDNSTSLGEIVIEFFDDLIHGSSEVRDSAPAELSAGSPDPVADPRQLQERLRGLLPEEHTAGPPPVPGAPAPPPAFDPAEVEDLVGILVEDAEDISDESVAAIHAAGVVAAGQPQLILNTLAAASKGDVQGAAYGLMLITTSPFGPSLEVVNAITAVVEQRLAELPGALSADTPEADDADAGPDTDKVDLPAAPTTPETVSANPPEQPDGVPTTAPDAPGNDHPVSDDDLAVATAPEPSNGDKPAPLLPEDGTGGFDGQMPSVFSDFEDQLKTVVADIKDQLKKAGDDFKSGGSSEPNGGGTGDPSPGD